jgi:hypothetical protein
MRKWGVGAGRTEVTFVTVTSCGDGLIRRLGLPIGKKRGEDQWQGLRLNHAYKLRREATESENKFGVVVLTRGDNPELRRYDLGQNKLNPNEN